MCKTYESDTLTESDYCNNSSLSTYLNFCTKTAIWTSYILSVVSLKPSPKRCRGHLKKRWQWSSQKNVGRGLQGKGEGNVAVAPRKHCLSKTLPLPLQTLVYGLPETHDLYKKKCRNLPKNYQKSPVKSFWKKLPWPPRKRCYGLMKTWCWDLLV